MGLAKRKIERQPDIIGHIYVDWVEEGDTPYARRALVLEGPVSLCAYVGVPLDHPLAGQSYDDFPLDVHGGLTYAGRGEQGYRPVGWYWYGWDYAHVGDVSKFDLKYGYPIEDKTDWTIPEVWWDAKLAMQQLRRLMDRSD